MSDAVDQEILDTIRERPGDWKIKLRGRLFTKAEVLAEYSTNEDLRNELRRLLMGLKLHELTREP
jgi:hypothetical protein